MTWAVHASTGRGPPPEVTTAVRKEGNNRAGDSIRRGAADATVVYDDLRK